MTELTQVGKPGRLPGRPAGGIILRMTRDDIKALLTRHPFEPLRVKTSNGEVFEIRHPEMVMLSKSVLLIAHPDAEGNPSDKIEYVSYLHITSIETAMGAAAP